MGRGRGTGSGGGAIYFNNTTLAVGAAGATFDFSPGLFRWLDYGALAGPGVLTPSPVA